MSKYVKYSLTSIRDRETLLAALAECGYSQGKVEVHDQSQTLYGIGGKARPEKAHIIIRRHNTGIGASNDIGFEHQSDGTYRAIVSEYDSHALVIRGTSFVDAVTTAYGKLNVNKTIKTLLTKTIPGLKLRGQIPQHATVHQETVGQQTKLIVRY